MTSYASLFGHNQAKGCGMSLQDKIRSGRIGASVAWHLRERRKQNFMHFAVSAEEAIAEGHGRTELGRLFFQHNGRSVGKWTQYLSAYDEQFGPYRARFQEAGRARPLRMLEIGVLHGGSLELWRKYFGADAILFGIDINPAAGAIDDPGFNVRIGSQADPAFLRRVVDEMGGVDIVLDDGSHIAKHQRASFETLFPMLSDGGLYAVEDLHTSYWLDFGGAYGRGASFIELAKTLIDDMHGSYHGRRPTISVDALHQVPRLTFYDSILFIEKRARPRPTVVSVGTTPS